MGRDPAQSRRFDRSPGDDVKVYLDGKILGPSSALIRLTELPEAGLAEAMKVVSGKVPLLKGHLERLAEGASALGMGQPSLKLVKEAVLKVIKANGLQEGSVRLRWFPRPAHLLVLAFKAGKFNPPPRHARTKGLRLMTVPTRHYGPASLQGRLKANAMLPNILAQWEARAWADDGLRLTPRGLVAEGAWANLLMEKKGVLYTAPLPQGVLEGTTRKAFLEAWRKKGRSCRETPLTRYDLYTADKVWVCSAIRGPLKVGEIDGRIIGNKL